LKTIKTIACFGGSQGNSGDPGYDAMQEVGRLLVEYGCMVATGGYGGTGMEAPARGANEAGGEAIGYTILGRKGNPFLTGAVDCRCLCNNTVDPSREIQYGVRLGKLLAADGFIVAATGGPGTMVEMMAVINLNCKLWQSSPKHLAILNIGSGQGAGWDANMLNRLSVWGVLPFEARAMILVAETPEEAVRWVMT